MADSHAELFCATDTLHSQLVQHTSCETSPARGCIAAATAVEQRHLRRETFGLPALTNSRIKHAIMQPVGPALPELDRRRQNAIPAPVRGSLRCRSLIFFGVRKQRFEFCAV